jgi:hypothetical protein
MSSCALWASKTAPAACHSQVPWNPGSTPLSAGDHLLSSTILLSDVRQFSSSPAEDEMKIGIWCHALALLSVASLYGQSPPLVDYHQHLFGPTVAKLSPGLEPLTASDLIVLLDAAGIQRALVLSIAYQFGNPNKPKVENEYAQVKAENDWTSQEGGTFSGPLASLVRRESAERLCARRTCALRERSATSFWPQVALREFGC